MFREVTYYTCTAIMFLFGFKMLWEAWKMDDNEAEEVRGEADRVGGRVGVGEAGEVGGPRTVMGEAEDV